MVDVANRNTRPALVGNALGEVIFGKSGKVIVQQVGAIRFGSCCQVPPRIGIIPGHIVSRKLLNRTWRDAIGVELDLGKGIGGYGVKELRKREHHRDKNRDRQYGMAARVTPKIQRPFHSLITLPVTTPEATEMIAFPVMGSSVRATPFLTGASTVLLPLLSTAVKETTVPSGTLFLRQSFTGSASTSTPFAVRLAFMCRLHASEATC